MYVTVAVSVIQRFVSSYYKLKLCFAFVITFVVCCVFINDVGLAQWCVKWPTADNVSRVTITVHTLLASHFLLIVTDQLRTFFCFSVSTEQRTGNCKVSSSGSDPLWIFGVQAIYSRTVLRQFSYLRQSYDIDTTPFAIHEKWRTYEWRKYERKSATYLPMSYDRHRRPFDW